MASSSTGVLRLCGLAWPIAHSLPSTSPQRLSGTMAALPKSNCVSWRTGVIGREDCRTSHLTNSSRRLLVVLLSCCRAISEMPRPTFLPLPRASGCNQSSCQDGQSMKPSSQRELRLEGERNGRLSSDLPHALYPLLLLLQSSCSLGRSAAHRHLAAAISVNWICAGVP